MAVAAVVDQVRRGIQRVDDIAVRVVDNEVAVGLVSQKPAFPDRAGPFENEPEFRPQSRCVQPIPHGFDYLHDRRHVPARPEREYPKTRRYFVTP